MTGAIDAGSEKLAGWMGFPEREVYSRRPPGTTHFKPRKGRFILSGLLQSVSNFWRFIDGELSAGRLLLLEVRAPLFNLKHLRGSRPTMPGEARQMAFYALWCRRDRPGMFCLV